ncbi:MAG: KilA-N domain-containing protein [Bacteroidota bacterium]
MASKLSVGNTPVRYTNDQLENSFFCLTDMCQGMDDTPSAIVQRWLRNRATLNFIEVWELEQNEDFNHAEFGVFKNRAGDNTFRVSADKLEAFNCQSIYSKKGRYGGTFAHVIVAFHFANWLSAQFYYQFVLSFLEFGEYRIKRIWSKLNYRLHTESIKNAIPERTTRATKIAAYSSEADMLNLVVFGMTAAQWRNQNPTKKGNIRDNTTKSHLHVLSNMEMLNSYLIGEGISKEDRARILLAQADYQFQFLHGLDKLKR